MRWLRLCSWMSLLHALAGEASPSSRNGAKPADRDVAPACFAQAKGPRPKALERGLDLIELRLLAVVELFEDSLDLHACGVLGGCPHLTLSQRTEFFVGGSGSARDLDPGCMERLSEFPGECRR